MAGFRTISGTHLGILAKRYRVIAYSRRNHFPNTVSGDGAPDVAADIHADDLAAVIKALGLARPHIVGHSSGRIDRFVVYGQAPERGSNAGLNEPNAISYAAWYKPRRP
jgi:pimeloyl-ACP methyl ester carboxylesterase